MLSVLLALAPAFLVFGLLIFRRTPGDIAGLIGWLTYCLVAWLYFDTPLAVLGKATIAGLIASLPVALIFASSIFQITIMGEAGAVVSAFWPETTFFSALGLLTTWTLALLAGWALHVGVEHRHEDADPRQRRVGGQVPYL